MAVTSLTTATRRPVSWGHLEVQPLVAVVARLEQVVSAAGGQQLREVHTPAV
jgi:hypothetical protein